MRERIISFGILGVSLVLTGIIISWTFYAVRASERNVITSTGSAKETIKSDTAKWTASISRRVPTSQLASGYTQIERDLAQLQAFLKQKNVDPAALEVRQINAQEDIYYGQDGAMHYPGTTQLQETLILSVNDVEAMKGIVGGLKELIVKGVPISTQSLEYYYSKLPELRVKLLGGAITDAKARSSEIAHAGGRSVGDLQSASSGVVQVLPPNSVEISDYGTYDTASLEKEVMVTVRATFAVN